MDATGCLRGWSSLSPCPDLVLDFCFRPLKSSCLVSLEGFYVVSVGSVWSLPSLTPLLGSCESDLQNRCSLSVLCNCTLSLPFDLLLSYPCSIWGGNSLSLSPNGHDFCGQSQMVLWDSQKINFAFIGFMVFFVCLSVCFFLSFVESSVLMSECVTCIPPRPVGSSSLPGVSILERVI